MSAFGPKIKKKPMAEINVVPYIDVMLVLLIVFMVAAPMMTQGVKVELPQANSQPIDPQEDEPIIVAIKKDGSYYITLGADPEQARPLADIKDIVSKVLRQSPKTMVLVQGDHSVDYGRVVALMSELQSAGAATVGMVTEPPR
jgi:biopolymer transport protein TolR